VLCARHAASTRASPGSHRVINELMARTRLRFRFIMERADEAEELAV
jgi:hypothetical protein